MKLLLLFTFNCGIPSFQGQATDLDGLDVLLDLVSGSQAYLSAVEAEIGKFQEKTDDDFESPNQMIEEAFYLNRARNIAINLRNLARLEEGDGDYNADAAVWLRYVSARSRWRATIGELTELHDIYQKTNREIERRVRARFIALFPINAEEIDLQTMVERISVREAGTRQYLQNEVQRLAIQAVKENQIDNRMADYAGEYGVTIKHVVEEMIQQADYCATTVESQITMWPPLITLFCESQETLAKGCAEKLRKISRLTAEFTANEAEEADLERRKREVRTNGDIAIDLEKKQRADMLKCEERLDEQADNLAEELALVKDRLITEKRTNQVAIAEAKEQAKNLRKEAEKRSEACEVVRGIVPDARSARSEIQSKLQEVWHLWSN